MTDQSNGLRFDIYERVHLPEEVPAIDELEEIELVPRIQVVQQGDQAMLKGQLLLSGVYRPQEPEAVSQTMEHRIPVEITLPMNRIERLADISVEIDNFDVDLLSVRTLNITGVLSLYGIKMEAAPEPDPSWQEEPFTVVHRREADFLPEAAEEGPAGAHPQREEEGAARSAAEEAGVSGADGEPEQSFAGQQDQAFPGPYGQSYAGQQDQAFAGPYGQSYAGQQDQAFAGPYGQPYARPQDQAFAGPYGQPYARPQDQAFPGTQDPGADYGTPQPYYRQPAFPEPAAYRPPEQPASELATPQATGAGDYGQPVYSAWTQQLQQALQPQRQNEPVTEASGGREPVEHSSLEQSAAPPVQPQPEKAPEPQGWDLLSGGAAPQANVQPEEEPQGEPARTEARDASGPLSGALAEDAGEADIPAAEREEELRFSPFFTETETTSAPGQTDPDKQEMRVAVGSKKPLHPPEPSRKEQSGLGLKSLLPSSGRREQEARGAAEQGAGNPAPEEEAAGGEEIEWKSLFLGRLGEEAEFRKVRLCIVQREETLDLIAERYRLNPREIALFNRLSDQSVAQGQVLYIP